MLKVIGSKGEVNLEGSFRGSFEERTLSAGNGVFLPKVQLEKLLKEAVDKTEKNLVKHLLLNFPFSLVDARSLPQEMLARSEGAEVVLVDMLVLEFIMRELQLEMSNEDFEKLDGGNKMSMMKLSANMDKKQ